MFTVSRYIRRTHYVCHVLRAPKEYVFLINPRDYFSTRCVALECDFYVAPKHRNTHCPCSYNKHDQHLNQLIH